MNGSNTYKERQDGENQGEILFEQYCREKGYQLQRIGFDEKNNNIPEFYDLNIYLRKLPDYVVVTPQYKYVVNVKGTPKFKKSEYDDLTKFEELYGSKKFPLAFAFCFKDAEPRIISVEKIKFLYKQGIDEKFKGDGVIYRKLVL